MMRFLENRSADMIANYPGGIRKDFAVSTYQMCILMMFNLIVFKKL